MFSVIEIKGGDYFFKFKFHTNCNDLFFVFNIIVVYVSFGLVGGWATHFSPGLVKTSLPCLESRINLLTLLSVRVIMSLAAVVLLQIF
jgi:hypothetical protein